MENEDNVRGALNQRGVVKRLRPGSKRARSAVTNGERAYVVGDGQSPWGRRHLDLVALHIDDLGAPESLSAAQVSLCQRAGALEAILEEMEGQMSLSMDVDLDMYGRLAGHLRRVLETLGVERVARPLDQPPTLAAIAAQIRAARPA